ncbi:YggL family protein [Agarivorans sp. Alg241-V36]|uniref:YggL 50S ribosome-binding family protein n=1 Tax=Agarivorans sp. Alg241-V36 TaxID=2305992 RepID=UPI0013D05675|nr:YggL family protein [Agarivorans sp. Alg241-V36]
MTKTTSRRLRKKLYLEEFAVFGFICACDLDETEAGFDLFLDELVDVVEARGLIIGGGGSAKEFAAFVASQQRYGSATEEDRQAVEQWLSAQPRTSQVVIGKLIDANYGV